MKLAGKLQHEDLEGGVWVLVANDGRRYELAAPPAGLKSGDSVEVDGDADSDSVSFQMAGTLLRVRSIRKR
jgi:hypothetical protein